MLSLESATALGSLYDVGKRAELMGDRQHTKSPLPDGSNLSLIVTHPRFSSPVEFWVDSWQMLSEGHPFGDYMLAQLDISREPASKGQAWFMGSYNLCYNPFMVCNPTRWIEGRGGWRSGKENDDLALFLYGPKLPQLALAVFSGEQNAMLFPEYLSGRAILPAA